MNEPALRKAIDSAISAAFNAAGTHGKMSHTARLEQARSFAYDLVVPVAVAMAEQAREEGWQAARRDFVPTDALQ